MYQGALSMTPGKRPRLVVINDNHAVWEDGRAFFPHSKFHLFLKAFDQFDTFLSTPVQIPQGQTLPDSLVIDGVKVLPRPAYGQVKNFLRGLPNTFRGQLQALQQHLAGADIALLVHPSVMAPVFLAANRRFGLPFGLYLIGEQDKVLRTGSGYNPLIRLLGQAYVKGDYWVLDRLARRAEVVFTLGKPLHDKFENRARQVQPVMTSLVRSDDVRKPQARPLPAPVTFLTASRLSPEKKIEVALQALEQLVAEGFDLRYVIAGDGPFADHLKAQAAALPHMRERTRFAGWTSGEALRELFCKSDIFLLPSASEGIPKVILEAMAAALPVISTRVGGIPDLIGVDRGWLCPPGDISALRSAISECLRDTAMRHDRLRKAHSYIRQHTTESEAERLQNALKAALVRLT